ncbi:MAG: DUF748 domain-containing protein [Congregibacter sp.]
MKSGLYRIARWLGIAYLVYVAICLLVVFPALNILTPGLVRDATNRELQSEIILFNPFTIALEVRRAKLVEEDDHKPLALKKFKVDLSLSSLWETGIVLDAFVIEELDVHVLRYADGAFHFADLLETSETSTSEGETVAPPAVTIREIAIDAHSIRYSDRTRPGPYRTELRDLALRKRNLTTVPDRKGDGALELIGDGGGTLRWRGDTDIAAGTSIGELSLLNIDLRPGWRYNAEQLGFVLKSGRLDARLDYAASWNGEPDFKLRRSDIRLHSVDIQPAAALQIEHTAVELDVLQLDGIELDLGLRQLALDEVALSGFRVSGVYEDEQVSLLQMFEFDTGTEPTVEAPQTNSPVEIDNSSSWSLAVKRISLVDSSTQWRTSLLSPEVLSVDPLRFSASEVQWPAVAASPFTLELALNQTAITALSGAMNLGTGTGDAQLSLQSLPLSWINPLVNEAARTDISRGELSLKTQVSLDAFAPDTITADLDISDFATVLHETDQEVFSLNKLAVSNAQIDIPEQSVRIAELALQRPMGSLHILEDGTMNINGVVRDTSTIVGDRETPSSDAPTGERSNVTEVETKPWRVALNKLTLREGQLDFADASLPLPFKTLIDNIQADASDIDTAAEKPLALLFTGSVDGYAPVRIEGSGRPLAAQRDGELQLDFQGMDIATMSPYSGTYAGYSIDSGTLSVNLRYGLDGQQLDGDNRIVISQMELGEPVESDLAMKLPLKLGLALLTDSAGVIDLSVPVSGNVNDPSFSLGPIIGTAIRNIIVKAVTAPFSLLAGLVGSEEDLENIRFAAGEATLGTDANSALEALAKALEQRPKLQLRIIGSSDPINDVQALRRAALRQSLLDEGLSEASIDLRDAGFMAAIGARFNALISSADADSNTEETLPIPSLEEQLQQLLATIELPPTALRSLGTKRAAAAKRELVNGGGIDAARIAISYDDSLGLPGSKMVVDS